MENTIKNPNHAESDYFLIFKTFSFMEKYLKIAFLLGGILVALGELWLQPQALSGKIEYNWFVGHLSDFAASMCLTACMALNQTHRSKLNIKALAFPLMWFVGLEFISLFFQVATVFDWQDVLCYLVGAAIVILPFKVWFD